MPFMVMGAPEAHEWLVPKLYLGMHFLAQALLGRGREMLGRTNLPSPAARPIRFPAQLGNQMKIVFLMDLRQPYCYKQTISLHLELEKEKIPCKK